MADAEKAKSPNFIEEDEKGKEGKNLLGLPTFEELENGRFKCIETGHELLSKDKESYSHSKRCRLGLVDSALSHGKAPLNMFKQDPLCRSKLVCKLTGDVVNKSEEHIWKHINGRRFLNKLEQKETEKLSGEGGAEEEMDKKKKKNKRVKASKLIAIGVNEELKKKAVKEDSNCESNERKECKSDSEELEFWVPPVGSRWDFDDGGDRWGSGTESGGSDGDNDDEMDGADEEIVAKSLELSMQAKRMSIEVGPSSFASRKKKRKGNSIDDQN
ncbi:hypothetical protein Syun_024256 [Stephania yunnanensis]|uniref:Surfeit locus protein 2 n=1 Tax=Stephania yunnanensis TaxID=152371 RepID=A0AAP0I414_9MAGN